ncbi:MAG: toprim domain-containing protein [Kiritimatiellae bacterium]|jgi:topoisomerase-4 subunit B|nr:toprim domain-containing protein [Kiritimatiellia bacterium]
MPNTYDDKNIQTLSAIEHIRKRTGMYIGRTSDGSQYEDGIYILLKEVLDNAVDEFIMGFGKRVNIKLNYNSGEVIIRDYGRGIPLGKVVDCVSQINTGGKFNDDAFQFSVGMNGVGTKAVNALSTDFEVRAFRENDYSEAFFSKGKLISRKRGRSKTNKRNGTYVRFIPDETIFSKYCFREEHVLRRLRMYAYLNAGLTFDLNGEQIISKNGLLDLIHDEAKFEKLYTPFHFRTKTLELVFTHTNRFNEEYYSFVNGQYTNNGGTHLSAFKEGILKAVNGFGKKKFTGDEVREGIIGAIAIRLKEPIFESQTKNKLGNQEIRSELVAKIKRVTEEMFHRDPVQAAKLIEKIEETSKLRAELNSVKKLARERAKKTTVRVPQLKDCKHHLNKKKGKGLDSMVFITEGQSAGGSITQCRDVVTQAIITVKGKPLNVCDLKRDALYKNVEIYNLMRSLDIEESVDNLRYQKVILATDADVDGLHIRNLMITVFIRFFKRVIQEGHLYILETPLFRVRNKKETHYCYSETERVIAMKKCGKNPEITRFKGLGEISPSEFKDFVGKEMRLAPVDSTRDNAVDETINFYMGRNTPDRRAYIMNHLVITEESLS